jgi:hypothetical protein
MPLSWNEIRARAISFSKEWETERSEHAEAKTFWDQFFNVFGVSRRRIATFEVPVKKGGGAGGFIDLLWKGELLVEHKSRGRDLDRAFIQAKDYFPGIKDRDLPRYVLVSDFARFRLHDLEQGTSTEFELNELYRYIRLFGFIAGYQSHVLKPEDPANIEAAELMGRLHDQLLGVGYEGHALELYLVRLLFCLFAEDTSIFERRQFQDYVEAKTSEDGSDLGHHLASLFYILNTHEDRRLRNLDEDLAAFPYVNGRLFEEVLPPASFDSKMRQSLLECCRLNWGRVSPAIFGSLFQSVLNTKLRRNLGAHYTTEQNILKVIRPLFLERLWEEFDRAKHSKPKLRLLHEKLSKLRFFDPACGCGNFLVVTYRELRMLELALLRRLYSGHSTGFLDVSEIVWIDVDQFYGIEVEEFPAQIAQVALWMTDHQMNMQISEEFGQYFRRLPLKKSPNIVCGDALAVDWTSVVMPQDLTFILGNPPFVGAKYMDARQRATVASVFEGIEGHGLLDFVAAWFLKAADFMQRNPKISAGLVATNSITQGEQVGVLWGELLRRGMKIQFAHRTFQWSSEARGKAAVHCVIVGFGPTEPERKILFDYATLQSEPHAVPATNINPYLVDAPDVVVTRRQNPLCNVPQIGIGNKPIDGGFYLFSPEEMAEFVRREPQAESLFRRWVGSVEFINNIERWCLWLGNIAPEQLRELPEAMKRVEAVRQFRRASISEGTRRLADHPTRFHVENMPSGNSLVIPEVSSERRPVIPIGFVGPDTLCSNLVKLVPNATRYHFGVLSSTMHMSWVRAVGGRLKSDYRYSKDIVYNNFPWPEPNPSQQKAVEEAAELVLSTRANFPTSSLADLYDPVSMPSSLRDAHDALDRAVDRAYQRARFKGERDRVQLLFRRYLELTAE